MLHLFQIIFLHFFLQIFRPVPVEGFLDDLIGQQLFIQMLLLAVVIGLIIIFSVYIFILIMVNNKDFISKQFKNKFILFFYKISTIFIKNKFHYFTLMNLLGFIRTVYWSLFSLNSSYSF